MVFKEGWLSLILAGPKTLEIRALGYKSGKYYLGCKGVIRGVMQLGNPVRIESDSEWNSLRHMHFVDSHERPYDKTYGLPILSASRLPAHVRYQHPRGAVGIVVYRR